MSTAEATAVRGVKPRQTYLVGRVEQVELVNNVRYTTIICPANDQYSSPEIITIRSKRPLGAKGDEIRQLCHVGGFRGRAFETKDKDTGEIRKVRQVQHTIDAIED